MVKKRSTRKTNKSFNRKKLLAGVALLVVVVGAIGIFENHKKPASSATASSSSSSTQTPKTNDNAANEAIKGAPTQSTPSTSPAQSTPNTTAPAASAGNFSVTINNASQQGNIAHVSVQVDGITSGTCDLTATQSGQTPVTAETSVVAQSTGYYICSPFNIPVSQFSASGNWNFNVTVTNNGASQSASSPITITK